MWADILGTGDFYYELGVQVVNICIALKKFNGGYLEESECLSMLKATRASKTQEVGVKDLRKAIESL
jgi:ESCRT-II complex subunit VPS22